MSVDLKLLILDGDFPEREFGFAHTVLETGACYEFAARVRKLETTPIPKDFSSYVARLRNGEYGYGTVQKDCYGDPIRCVRAGELAKVRGTHGFHRLAAALAYVKALPPETRIALYWH